MQLIKYTRDEGAKVEETFPCDHEQWVKQEGNIYIYVGENGVKQEKDKPFQGVQDRISTKGENTPNRLM